MPVHCLLVEIWSEEQIRYLDKCNVFKMLIRESTFKKVKEKRYATFPLLRRKSFKKWQNQLQSKNILLYYSISSNCCSGLQLKSSMYSTSFFSLFHETCTLTPTCLMRSDLEPLLCTAGGCCSASLWFCSFESDADWEGFIKLRADASLWGHCRERRRKKTEFTNHMTEIDFSCWSSKYKSADVTTRQTWCSVVINRGWHFHSSRLSRSAQDLASMHICIRPHKNSTKCPNLLLSAFWSAKRS